MLKVNEEIVKNRLRKDRERMDRLMREMNDWPREKEEKERQQRKEKREKEEKEREERKEKERQERKEKKDKESEMEVQQWIDTSGLSTSKLASRLGRIHTEEEDSVASSPKAIGDDDAEMEDVEKGLRQDALSSTLKAGTSRQPSAALLKDVASTGTDSQPDFGSFVATPGASSYDSGRDDVDDDSEDRRSRQRTKSGGEAHTSRNLEGVRNLMTEFLDASDRRRDAGEPENDLEAWKEAALILHVEPSEQISEGEKAKEEGKQEKKEKKKEVSFKEEQKGRRERKREKEEEERKKEDKMRRSRKKEA